MSALYEEQPSLETICPLFNQVTRLFARYLTKLLTKLNSVPQELVIILSTFILDGRIGT